MQLAGSLSGARVHGQLVWLGIYTESFYHRLPYGMVALGFQEGKSELQGSGIQMVTLLPHSVSQSKA